MFRQRILIVAATLLLHFGAAGIALSQTGPITNSGVVQPNANVQRFDNKALRNLLEARNPDARTNGQSGMYRYFFTETVHEVAYRVFIIWRPSKNQVEIQVTVSESLSTEQVAVVRKQFPEWNAQVTPHTFDIDKVCDTSVLVIQSVLTNPATVQDVEAELNRVLGSVAKTQPLWANLR